MQPTPPNYSSSVTFLDSWWKKKVKKINAAESKILSFFSLFCTFFLPAKKTDVYPQCNCRQFSERSRCITLVAATVASSLEQRWRGLVSSLPCNFTPPDFFFFFPPNLQSSDPNDADSSDITWGNSPHFTQLPLETQKALFSWFSHMLLELSSTWKHTAPWARIPFSLWPRGAVSVVTGWLFMSDLIPSVAMVA